MLDKPKTRRRLAEASQNLAGQKLGRKGQETRERIIFAMLRLLEDREGPPVTLTSVAREASIRLTNVYLYFPDFGELFLAAINRVMVGDADYLDLARTRWPDARLNECCLDFVQAHYQFWRRHARLLHMRNLLSDTDNRILEHRLIAARPLIQLLILQMDGRLDDPNSSSAVMAAVMVTNLEMLATVVTNQNFHFLARYHGEGDDEEFIAKMMRKGARLLELAIRDERGVTTKKAPKG